MWQLSSSWTLDSDCKLVTACGDCIQYGGNAHGWSMPVTSSPRKAILVVEVAAIKENTQAVIRP